MVIIFLSCTKAKRESGIVFIEGCLYINDNREMDEWLVVGAWNKETETNSFELQNGVIKQLFIGSDVDAIPDEAFSDLMYLESVYFESEIESIGQWAFSDCINLTSIYIPDSVTEIGSAAFYGCEALQTVNIPINLIYMSDGMFHGCDALSELRIPSTVKIIDDSAIGGRNLQRIIFEGTIEKIVKLYLHSFPRITQLVFLDTPPVEYGANQEVGLNGMTFNAEVLPTVYYLRNKIEYWSPNGETQWNGCPIIAIDSLEDLPPLD